MDLPHSLVDRLIGISQALAGHTDPGEAFRATAAELGQLIAFDHIDIAVMSPDRDMHMVYEVGPRTSWSALANNPLPTDSSPVRLVMRREEPYLLTADALSDSRFHFDGALNGPIYAARLRSRIIVPMRTRGDIVGSLNISRQIPNCYTKDDVDLAQICADFLTPYIAALIKSQEARRANLAERRARRRERQLRRGASRLTEDMDRESRRLAMDLHDQTLGDLARVARHISNMRARGSTGDEELEELEALVNVCLTELRGIIDDMQPSMLQLFGMRDALEAHLAKSIQYTVPQIEVSVTDTTGGEVDKIQEPERTALYRIAQEAINNAARHAHATAIQISIDQEDDVLKIEVGDNGCGIGAADLEAQGGLSNMQTRATLIGARLRVESRKSSRGTSVMMEYNIARQCQRARKRVVQP